MVETSKPIPPAEDALEKMSRETDAVLARSRALVNELEELMETGRQLRAAGPDGMFVALYLLTNNHANMIGLYYLPLPYLVHESGLSLERASKGLQTGFGSNLGSGAFSEGRRPKKRV